MSLLNLTCPMQQPGQDLLVETHYSELKQSIDDIPYGNIHTAQSMILDKLTKLNRISLASKDRFQILTLFQGPYHIIFEYFLDSLKQTSNKQDVPIPEDLKHLTQEMSYGYKILIREISSNRSITAGNQLIAEIFNLTLSYLERLLIEYYLRYEHPPNYLWREVYQLFHYAEARGFHTTKTKMKDEYYCAENIESTFKRILLLALASPNQFERGRLAHILDYLNRWAGKAQLLGSDQVMDALEEQRKQAFLIDLSGDQKPSHREVDIDNANLSALRLLDTSYLIYSLESQTINLKGPSQLKDLGLPKTITVRDAKDLLREVANRWDEKLERCSERFQSNKVMDFIWGVPAIFMELKEQEIYVKQVEAAEQAEASKENKINVLQPAPLEQHFQRWRSVNISQGGLQLHHDDNNLPKLEVGQLAMSRIHGKDASAKWQLCVIRWLEETSKRGINLGVETIVGNVATLKLTTLSERSLEPIERPALYMPPMKTSKDLPTIITLTNAYYKDRKMEMELGGEVVSIQAKDRFDYTEHYTRFNYTEASTVADVQIEEMEAFIEYTNEYDTEEENPAGNGHIEESEEIMEDEQALESADETEAVDVDDDEPYIEEEIILQDTSQPSRSRD